MLNKIKKRNQGTKTQEKITVRRRLVRITSRQKQVDKKQKEENLGQATDLYQHVNLSDSIFFLVVGKLNYYFAFS